MPTLHSQASELIDEYIKRAPAFSQPILKKLRQIIRKADPKIVEDWKWGPNFNRNGMVCGFGAFKNHVSFVFFQGASLKDTKKILSHGGSNQHNRTIKFTDLSEVDEKTLIANIKEAVQINLKGVRSEPAERTIDIPADFKNALAANKKAGENFENFAYTFRKEYVKWIEESRKPETRVHRLKQAIEQIAAGRKIHEKK